MLSNYLSKTDDGILWPRLRMAGALRAMACRANRSSSPLTVLSFVPSAHFEHTANSSSLNMIVCRLLRFVLVAGFCGLRLAFGMCGSFGMHTICMHKYGARKNRKTASFSRAPLLQRLPRWPRRPRIEYPETISAWLRLVFRLRFSFKS